MFDLFQKLRGYFLIRSNKLFLTICLIKQKQAGKKMEKTVKDLEKRYENEQKKYDREHKKATELEAELKSTNKVSITVTHGCQPRRLKAKLGCILRLKGTTIFTC